MYRLLIAYLLLFPSILFAYEVQTHKGINEHTINNTTTEIDQILKDNYGFENGYGDKVNNKYIVDWVGLGGAFEDNPVGVGLFDNAFSRFTHHFHDPTKEMLEEAGLSGLIPGMSTVLWAQMDIGTQRQPDNFSWKDAREYFFKALTETDVKNRNEQHSKTFRGLGQVMHLLQDMASPAHTRNDAHVSYNYETRVKEIKGEAFATILASSIGHNFPELELSTESPFAEADVPIARLFDNELFKEGVLPQVTLQPNIGLSEFTSANFISEDTVPNLFTKTYPNYSEPCIESTWLDAPDDYSIYGIVRRLYHQRTLGCSDAGEEYLLSGTNFFEFATQDIVELGDLTDLEKIPPMDNKVYDNYAKLLLPRAAGYSASLLKYFFRGDFNVEGYDITDSQGNVVALQFDVENITENEGIRNGQFVVVGSYRLPNSEEVKRVLSDPFSSGDLPADGTVQTYVAMMSTPIPKNAVERSYMLVYRGELGYEKDAVVGKVMDILTPVWEEHWETTSLGSHPWEHTENALPEIDPEKGAVENLVISERLVKVNTRYQGVDHSQANETLVNIDPPIAITPDTMINLKVDNMILDPVLPQQACEINPWGTPAYQKIDLRFMMGNGSIKRYHYTVEGHEDDGSRAFLVPGYHWYDNLYEILNQVGTIIEPVTLNQISIKQGFMPLCDDIASDQTQTMSIDYLRVLDKARDE